MNNEDKILEILGGLTEAINNLTVTVNGIQGKLNETRKELQEFRKETSENFNNLSDKVNNLEGNNGARHIELSKEIKQLRSDFTVIEVVTGKNMTDIAQLKAIN